MNAVRPIEKIKASIDEASSEIRASATEALSESELPTELDLARLELQLGRVPRGVRRIAARCGDGWPAVVETAPVLEDGTPFPTLYYLTCRKLNAALSTLESQGLMRELNDRLVTDSEFAADYERAHIQYLRQRDRIAIVPQIAGYSTGGMPDRVKCLHALAAHSLAAGQGVNPAGDVALLAVSAMGVWPHTGNCVDE